MFARIYTHTKLNPLPSVVGMLLFWGLFDSAIGYLAPVLIDRQFGSNTEVGILLATSSIAGAIFDAVLGHFVRKPHFKKFYLLMLAVCAITPFVLLPANTIWMFVVAMSLWGLYFDLCSFGNTDFGSRLANKNLGGQFFSLLQLVKGIGFLISPVIVSFLLRENEGALILLLTTYIAFAFSFYFLLRHEHNKHPDKEDKPEKRLSLFNEVLIWKKISNKTLGPLIFIVLFSVFDATFMTIGPLLAESFRDLHPAHGIFVSAYWLPALLLGLYLPRVMKKFGGVKTAYIGLLAAGLVLFSFPLAESALALMILVFISSVFSSMCAPAISYAFSQAVRSDRAEEREITALQDLATNIGFIIGPILAGVLADRFSYQQSFAVIGAVTFGATCGLIVLKIMQKKKSLLN